MARYYDDFSDEHDDYLAHTGNKNSGRYKRGSGQRPFQHMFNPTLKNGKGPNQSPFEKTMGTTGKGIESVQKTEGAIHGLKNVGQDIKNRNDARHMTDDELRQVINRKNLEKQYAEAMADPARDYGHQKLQAILGTVGTAVSIAGGIATIYSAFHQPKNSNP